MSSFCNDLKKARIAGHPIHAMLVHFPSALFPISLVFDILSIIMQSTCLACAAFYCIAAGILAGMAAAFVGAMHYSRLPATHPAWNKASLHALLNITWLILFGIVFGLRVKQYPNLGLATPLEMTISTIAVIGLIYSNYLGGVLVFGYKLGFDEKDQPK
ncbi:MAG: DUF2231 domain-containing protein [Gammaproteobacteria bacterium]